MLKRFCHKLRRDGLGRQKRPPLSSFLALASLGCLTLILSVPAHAMHIERVISSKGVEAWLVEEHGVPLITMRFAFEGGASQDLPGGEGVAHFVSGMLDEGAGKLSSVEYHDRLEDLAARMRFDASRDVFSGTFQTLTKNQKESFELLRLALTSARMDQDAVERIRGQIQAGIKIDQEDPEKVAAQEWFKLAFHSHPYARPVNGTAETVARISADDLRNYVKRNFARDNLKVAVVGDITPDQLKAVLDDVFGGLAEKADLKPVPEVKLPAVAERKVIPMKVPQSVAAFGAEGLKRKDKDFIAAYVLNYIIGGGGFSSKLMEEVREKRGLAYSVYSYLQPFRKASVFLGGVATENKALAESIKVIEAELGRIAKDGPTAEELESAKRYLTGSYALNFDTSAHIAAQLLGVQIEDLGIDYFDRRNAMVEAVTLDDIRRVADRLIKPGALIVTVVGQPEGMMNAAAAPGDKAPAGHAPGAAGQL
jgi:zinc protease